MLKLDLSADESEQSVIRSATDIVAGMDLGASLANDNVACEDCLTVCPGVFVAGDCRRKGVRQLTTAVADGSAAALAACAWLG